MANTSTATLACYQGEDVTILTTITGKDITGWLVTFRILENNNAAPTVEKTVGNGITLTDSANGSGENVGGRGFQDQGAEGGLTLADLPRLLLIGSALGSATIKESVLTPRALARAITIAQVGSRPPCSNFATVVSEHPARTANSSCVSPAASR